jgi:hypothetical protein
VSFVQSLLYLIGELIGGMGYLGYFYVENKSFEFRSNVQGGVQLAEKSRGKLER